MQAGLLGKLLLAPLLSRPQTAQVRSKAMAYVHAAAGTPMSPINLQTISDIAVDFAAT